MNIKNFYFILGILLLAVGGVQAQDPAVADECAIPECEEGEILSSELGVDACPTCILEEEANLENDGGDGDQEGVNDENTRGPFEYCDASNIGFLCSGSEEPTDVTQGGDGCGEYYCVLTEQEGAEDVENIEDDEDGVEVADTENDGVEEEAVVDGTQEAEINTNLNRICESHDIDPDSICAEGEESQMVEDQGDGCALYECVPAGTADDGADTWDTDDTEYTYEEGDELGDVVEEGAEIRNVGQTSANAFTVDPALLQPQQSAAGDWEVTCNDNCEHDFPDLNGGLCVNLICDANSPAEITATINVNGEQVVRSKLCDKVSPSCTARFPRPNEWRRLEDFDRPNSVRCILEGYQDFATQGNPGNPQCTNAPLSQTLLSPLEPIDGDTCIFEVCDRSGNCSTCESAPLKFDDTPLCAEGQLQRADGTCEDVCSEEQAKRADGTCNALCHPDDDDCLCILGDTSKCREDGPINCYTSPFHDRCPGFENPACLIDPFTPGCPIVNPCFPNKVYDVTVCPIDAVRFCARNPYHYGCNTACKYNLIDCDPDPPAGANCPQLPSCQSGEVIASDGIGTDGCLVSPRCEVADVADCPGLVPCDVGERFNCNTGVCEAIPDFFAEGEACQVTESCRGDLTCSTEENVCNTDPDCTGVDCTEECWGTCVGASTTAPYCMGGVTPTCAEGEKISCSIDPIGECQVCGCIVEDVICPASAISCEVGQEILCTDSLTGADNECGECACVDPCPDLGECSEGSLPADTGVNQGYRCPICIDYDHLGECSSSADCIDGATCSTENDVCNPNPNCVGDACADDCWGLCEAPNGGAECNQPDVECPNGWETLGTGRDGCPIRECQDEATDQCEVFGVPGCSSYELDGDGCSSGICTACIAGYNLVDGGCEEVAVDQCGDVGFGLPGCSSYELDGDGCSSGTCTACVTGYNLVDGVCERVPEVEAQSVVDSEIVTLQQDVADAQLALEAAEEIAAEDPSDVNTARVITAIRRLDNAQEALNQALRNQ